MSRFHQIIDYSSQLRQMLGPFARAIIVVTPQGRFAVPIEDMFVGADLRRNGEYATEELKTLRGICNAQTRLLVVGAHIGALAIPMARACKSVVAIEANPATFELLQFNINFNELRNCRAIHKAASNKVEVLEFVQNTVNSGGSKRLPLVRNEDYYYDNPQLARVDAMPLDDLLAGETFDAVVMDIEGSEYFALQGMQRILSTAGMLQVEFIPQHLKEVAGVSAEDFAAQIAPHFATMALSHRRLAVGRDRFASTLSEMAAANEGVAAIHFLKMPPENVRFQDGAAT